MTLSDQFSSTNNPAVEASERIYHAWDEALGKKDLEASLALYAEDATLESPLVRHLRQSDRGSLRARRPCVPSSRRCSEPNHPSASAIDAAFSPMVPA